ncbi:GNAT family N-acetyltransferase [Streptomyces uncialis]|uniref:GNAT family N-acetyltransferase n=1 Tax=Streptomyces uncialis TaxID=1048205 RepID=UPI00364A7B68
MSREMSDALPAVQSRPVRHRWRRDVVELAALFTAVAAADTVAHLIGHGPDGPELLLVSAAVLLATAGFHVWWARRHGHAPPAADTGARPPAARERSGPGGDSVNPGDSPVRSAPSADGSGRWTSPGNGPGAGAPSGATALWRMRATVQDAPGSLAALCAALAHREVDILSLQTHPLTRSTVDEFLLRAPRGTTAAEVAAAVSGAGGTDIWIERADPHDLVDAPTRVLSLATRTALDAGELPSALRALLGRCTVRTRSAPADGAPGPVDGGTALPVEGALEGTVIRLHAPGGGTLVVERPYPPFTPTEFARARALVELDTRLGPRVPRGQDVLPLPHGEAVTVRRADLSDVDAATAMHGRCSSGTLRTRYHGPVQDADRYLRHLLNPHFGRTLVARTAAGRTVALGHLLWDGDETEVALLVEDEWQRRGIGGELLRRLADMAAEAGCARLYALTQPSNTGMIAAMRGLGLPLEHQWDEGALVITARLDTRPAGPADPASRQGSRLGTAPFGPAAHGTAPLGPAVHGKASHGAAVHGTASHGAAYVS